MPHLARNQTTDRYEATVLIADLMVFKSIIAFQNTLGISFFSKRKVLQFPNARGGFSGNPVLP